MKRREFVSSTALAAAMYPLWARAQQRETARVGFLTLADAQEPYLTFFRQALRELGYIEGKSVRLELRAPAKPEMLLAAAADLVRQKVHVIATVRAGPAEAAKRATKDIPIVLAHVADAVALGLVASLPKPGGNVTGLSVNMPETSAKMLELVREIMPAARRVAAIIDSSDPFGRLFFEQIEHNGQRLGLEIQAIRVKGVSDVSSAAPLLTAMRPHAAILQPTLGRAAADLVRSQRIPPISPNNVLAASCLMTYSADIADMFRKAAVYVDRLLKGARAADLPVEQPAKFELVINLKTAQDLDITVPRSILLRVVKVIE